MGRECAGSSNARRSVCAALREDDSLPEAVWTAHCHNFHVKKQGVIQAFEPTYELSWKLLQDYLRCQGYEHLTGLREWRALRCWRCGIATAPFSEAAGPDPATAEVPSPRSVRPGNACRHRAAGWDPGRSAPAGWPRRASPVAVRPGPVSPPLPSHRS
ncbi:hypothetical protein F3089_15070 [Halospina sp. K52047b]|nr:hypothetical protein F3089_15070 [Halospina sp. K52047b]